jgi:hypothetical protein
MIMQMCLERVSRNWRMKDNRSDFMNDLYQYDMTMLLLLLLFVRSEVTQQCPAVPLFGPLRLIVYYLIKYMRKFCLFGLSVK